MNIDVTVSSLSLSQSPFFNSLSTQASGQRDRDYQHSIDRDIKHAYAAAWMHESGSVAQEAGSGIADMVMDDGDMTVC